MTAIEWTDKTWNPFVGCSKISEGCRNCYAINQAYRNNAIAKTMPTKGRMKYYEGLTHKKGDHVEWTGLVRFVPEALEIPLRWKKPRKIFVNSMSDLFHESIPFEQIDQVFAVMALSLRHTYQVLTKRPERMEEYVRSAKNRVRIAAVDLGRTTKTEHVEIESCQWDWPLPNVWLGVTVENQKTADERIPVLLQTHTALRFLSCEPLLESVNLTKKQLNANQYNYLLNSWSPYGGGARGATAGCRISTLQSAIDWVIVGGESGSGARLCDTDWIYSIVEQCQSSRVPVFVKQMGSKVMCECRTPEHPAWDELGPIYRISGKGGDMQQWPERLRVREFPVPVSR
jgi:protein gp37